MNMIVKSSLVAVLFAGAATIAPIVASAGVNVTVGIGGYAPGPGYSPYDGQVYYDPIYFGGAWYHGPYRWRRVHGQRVFWVDGGWHRNEWRGRPIPASLTFRNGGYFRSGRYEGFENAERINTRFNAGREVEHGDRADIRSDRSDMPQDRNDMQSDRDHMQVRREGTRDRGDMHEQGNMRGRPGNSPPGDDDSRSNDSGTPHN